MLLDAAVVRALLVLALVSLSAYRIVQEALTNTLKHTGARKATVVLRYGMAGVELEVRDNGHGPIGEGSGGRGIVGMRERAALYGGSFWAGPAPGGGFIVSARFPLEGASS
jgi:signal transduction histidine kinase